MHRPIFTLLLLGVLSACASAAQDKPVEMRHSKESHPKESHAMPAMAQPSYTLGVGEQTTLRDGSTLRYQRLVNDSRCPPNVQCVWAGDAEIELRWQPNSGAAQTVSLHTHPLRGKGVTEATLGDFRIHLQSLERGIAPKATLTVTPAR